MLCLCLCFERLHPLLCAGREMLDGPAREHLLELINIHDELDGLVSYESFRDGFILGARLMMEVACGQSRFNGDG